MKQMASITGSNLYTTEFLFNTHSVSTDHVSATNMSADSAEFVNLSTAAFEVDVVTVGELYCSVGMADTMDVGVLDVSTVNASHLFGTLSSTSASISQLNASHAQLGSVSCTNCSFTLATINTQFGIFSHTSTAYVSNLNCSNAHLSTLTVPIVNSTQVSSATVSTDSLAASTASVGTLTGANCSTTNASHVNLIATSASMGTMSVGVVSASAVNASTATVATLNAPTVNTSACNASLANASVAVFNTVSAQAILFNTSIPRASIGMNGSTMLKICNRESFQVHIGYTLPSNTLVTNDDPVFMCEDELVTIQGQLNANAIDTDSLVSLSSTMSILNTSVQNASTLNASLLSVSAFSTGSLIASSLNTCYVNSSHVSALHASHVSMDVFGQSNLSTVSTLGVQFNTSIPIASLGLNGSSVLKLCARNGHQFHVGAAFPSNVLDTNSEPTLHVEADLVTVRGELVADSIDCDTLTAGTFAPLTVNTSSLNASALSASNATLSTLSTVSVHASHLNGSQLSVSHAAHVSTNTSTGYVSTLHASNIYGVSIIVSAQGNIGTVNSTTGNIGLLHVSTGNICMLTVGGGLNASTLSSSVATILSTNAGQVNASLGYVSTCTVSTLNVCTGNIRTANSSTINTVTANVQTANLDSVSAIMMTCDYSELLDVDVTNFNCSTGNFSTFSVSSFAPASITTTSITCSNARHVSTNTSTAYTSTQYVSVILGATMVVSNSANLTTNNCGQLNCTLAYISTANINNLSATSLTSSNITTSTMVTVNVSSLTGNVGLLSSGYANLSIANTSDVITNTLTCGIANVSTAAVSFLSSGTFTSPTIAGGTVAVATVSCTTLNCKGTGNISTLNVSNISTTLDAQTIGGFRFEDATYQYYIYPRTAPSDGLSYLFSYGKPSSAFIQNCAAGGNITFRVAHAVKCYMNSSGYFGYGTTTPLCPIHVTAVQNVSITVQAGGGKRYEWNGMTSVAAGTSLRGLSMICQDNIACRSVFCGESMTYASDRRHKRDIVDIDDPYALSKIRQLRPRQYRFVDERRSDALVLGFIAQEVEESLPDFVGYEASVLPNIQQNGKVVNGIISVSEPMVFELDDDGKPFLDFEVYGESFYKPYRVTCEIIDATHLRITSTIEDGYAWHEHEGVSYCRVHGQYVNNFRSLKSDHINTLAIAAIQQIDRELQAERAKVITLEAQVADLLARVSALEA